MTEQKLPCVCGHEKDAHLLPEEIKKLGRFFKDKTWHCIDCPCKKYRPCIPLSDLWALLYETREEVSSHEEVSIRGKHPERAQGVEVYFHALKRKLRELIE